MLAFILIAMALAVICFIMGQPDDGVTRSPLWTDLGCAFIIVAIGGIALAVIL